MRQRSDVARNRQAILHAATLLYQQVDDVTAITMDDIAAAAGVGKGTVFRRFGDRAGLLRAVFDEQIATLIETIETGPPPLGPATPPPERVAAMLVAIIEFKIDNRRLTRALEDIEQRPSSPRFYETANYQWTHKLLHELLADQADPHASGYHAHALLSLTRIDLIEHLLDTEKYTRPQLQRLVLEHVSQITAPAHNPRNA
jgi:AcrR family transcriptional regulator